MSLKSYCCLLIGLVVFGDPHLCWCNSPETFQTVVVWGESEIKNGNLVEAKEQALYDGFRQAIIKVLGIFISSETFMENFLSLEESVLHQRFGKTVDSRTRGYIKTYDILETDQQPNIVRQQIRAVVSREPIKDDLTSMGILLDAIGNPIIEIRGNDEGLDSPKSLFILKDLLKTDGLYIVDNNDKIDPDLMLQVEGTSKSQSIFSDTGLHCAIVELRCESREQGTKRLISVKHSEGNGCGFNDIVALEQAYERAAMDIAPLLVDDLTEKWWQEVNSGRALNIWVKADGYNKTVAFSNYLGRIFGVKKVDYKSFKKKEAMFFVRFSGQTETLVKLLLRLPPNGMSISILGFDANTIQVALD